MGAAYTGEFWLPQSPLRIWLAVTTPMPARVHSLAQDRKGLRPGPAVTYPMASAFSFFFFGFRGEREWWVVVCSGGYRCVNLSGRVSRHTTYQRDMVWCAAWNKQCNTTFVYACHLALRRG